MAKGMIVDFDKIEAGGGGGGARVPEGDYHVKVVECKLDTSKNSGNTMFVWRYEIVDGKHKGKKLKPDYTTVTKDAMWRLKNLIDALGLGGKLDLEKLPKKVIDLELGVSVEDEEYNDKMQSKVAGYLSLEELNKSDDDDDDDTEEEPKEKKKGKKKGKKGKKDKADDGDEIEDLDLDSI